MKADHFARTKWVIFFGQWGSTSGNLTDRELRKVLSQRNFEAQDEIRGDSGLGGLLMRRIPTLAEVERRHIFNTLALCENNRTRAAKLLGVSIRGLRLKLHEYEHEGYQVPPPGNGRPDHDED